MRKTKPSCCASDDEAGAGAKPKHDLLLWTTTLWVILLYLLPWWMPVLMGYVAAFFSLFADAFGWLVLGLMGFLWMFLKPLHTAVFELMNTMWWGMLSGFVMIAILSKVPRKFVLSIAGNSMGFGGILRAVLAGVLLDFCNHGLLMIAVKLYERGVSIGQVIAFLVASPWNSFSLTLILFALIGWKWTLAFIAFSMLIALITGWLFNRLVHRGVLPDNPNRTEVQANFRFWSEARKRLAATDFNAAFFISALKQGAKDSRMVLRWVMLGIVLSALVRAYVPTDIFATFFGATFLGLLLTLVSATIMEICSEGSTPIAADLLTRAKAPGNSFAFLMTGVATDYTEIAILKESTRSWRIPLFLPLLTIPQILLIAVLTNGI